MKEQLETLVEEMYKGGIIYSEAVREFKKRFIVNVIRHRRGNQVRAAVEMGMHRNTLSRALAELKIDVREMSTSTGRRSASSPKPVQPAAITAVAGARQA